MKLRQDSKFMQNLMDKYSERCPLEPQYYIMKNLYKTGCNGRWMELVQDHAKGQTLPFAIFNLMFLLQVSVHYLNL
jgi:hypothetical protein